MQTHYIEQFRDKTKPEGVVHQTYPPAPIQYLEAAKKITEKSQTYTQWLCLKSK